MCDVLVAMPDATRSGKIIFGKNSDRPVDDCQVVHYSEGGDRDPRSRIQCSYVTIPESRRILATLGCRPYWCWGYETGMNEVGVVGGNAAVFTRGLKAARTGEPLGLTGMDLLRLGLERGGTAEQAVDVIVGLLEEYGQWGSGVPGKDHEQGSYDNSFLLVDREAAWVLETSGRRWVAERVVQGVRSISNELTIRNQWTKGRPDLQEFASNRGWWSPDDGDLDFALVYADHENYSRQVSHIRRMRSHWLLRHNEGALDPATMMHILRDHYEGTFLDGPQFHPFLPDFLTLCMHVSPSGFTWGNTATSVVVEIDPNDSAPPPFWVSYLPPCSSLYTAYYLGVGIPEAVALVGTAGLSVRPGVEAPKDQFSETSLWWRFRRLIDAIQQDPMKRWQAARAVFDPIEARRLTRVRDLMAKPAGTRGHAFGDFVREQVEETTEALGLLERRWIVGAS